MLIKHTTKELDLIARLMRSEAVGEGNEGMLMVGNVVINRALADCHTFKKVNTLYDVIYQANQFAGTTGSLFYASSTAHEKTLAKRVIKGEYFYPATHSLWFYAPSGTTSCKATWYDQKLAGRFKNHCFYKPDPNICRQIH